MGFRAVRVQCATGLPTTTRHAACAMHPAHMQGALHPPLTSFTAADGLPAWDRGLHGSVRARTHAHEGLHAYARMHTSNTTRHLERCLKISRCRAEAGSSGSSASSPPSARHGSPLLPGCGALRSTAGLLLPLLLLALLLPFRHPPPPPPPRRSMIVYKNAHIRPPPTLAALPCCSNHRS